MPSVENNDKLFAGTIIEIGKDKFHLDYIYFKEENNKIISIETSLPQLNKK
jgi:hypothetical protein